MAGREYRWRHRTAPSFSLALSSSWEPDQFAGCLWEDFKACRSPQGQASLTRNCAFMERANLETQVMLVKDAQARECLFGASAVPAASMRVGA